MKEELVEKFKNPGRTRIKSGEPIKVNTYNLRSTANEIAIPYGIFDVTENNSIVNIGDNHDTSKFAVESILQ